MVYFFLAVIQGMSFAGDDAVLIRLGGEVSSISEEAPPPPVKRKISLDLEKADIHSVIRLFAQVSGQNFVVSDGVEGTVTVRLSDVPWDQALQVILLSNGLMAQELGGVVVVGTSP